jgi:thiol-disulfide isomerase/thioredoxin
MKKGLFIVLSICVSFFSCKEKNAYTITGSFSADCWNGKYVYLLNFDGRKPNAIDSTIVENRQFAFSGIASDTPRVCSIAFDKAGAYAYLILEKGDIKMTLDTAAAPVFSVANTSGTLLNDSLQKLVTELNSLYAELYGKMNEPEKELTKEQYLQELDAQKTLDAQCQNTLYGYIKSNMATPVGEYFFLSNASYLKDDMISELIALSLPQFKESERVQRIGDRAKARIATKEGTTFSDINGLTPDGKAVALSNYAGKGKIVLVDFWASWCGPCIRSLPALKAVYEKHKRNGFEIVGVSLDDEGDAWKNAIKTYGITWIQFSNLKGWNDPSAATYGITSIPRTILIGADGTVLAQNIEPRELDYKLDELLK